MTTLNKESLLSEITDGMSSAMANIAYKRGESDLEDLNLTDEEYQHILDEVFHYVVSKFGIQSKGTP
jgi:hypothetical protein